MAYVDLTGITVPLVVEVPESSASVAKLAKFCLPRNIAAATPCSLHDRGHGQEIRTSYYGGHFLLDMFVCLSANTT